MSGMLLKVTTAGARCHDVTGLGNMIGAVCVGIGSGNMVEQFIPWTADSVIPMRNKVGGASWVRSS